MHDWKPGDLAKCIDPDCGNDPINGKPCSLNSEHIVLGVELDPEPCSDCGGLHIWLRFPGFTVEWAATSFVPVTKFKEEPKMRIKELI